MSGAGQEPAPGPARDLGARIADRIRSDGPISVGAFMAEALHDARAGYYATKDPIGAGGDYLTAPEASQMFGELIGLWALQCWLDMGAPKPFRLIELGPGRGAMMADALRAASMRPEFLAATSVSLVELSPALKAVQARTLANAPVPAAWIDRLDKAPAGPAVVIGNEFLDCLPVRQFVREKGQWRERVVALDPAAHERFIFALAAAPASSVDIAMIPKPLRELGDGALVETRPSVDALLDTLGQRFADAPARALFIDYGPAESEPGDTLQAVVAHQKVDPLEAPGERDLTARVDFAALKAGALARGLAVAGPAPQGEFLNALGLEPRAAALISARPDMKSQIARQVFRLSDPSQMGALFKVIALSAPGMGAPPGF